MSLEQSIIEFCSPTLAGIKTGSLFTIRFKDISCLEKQVKYFNLFFRSTGVSILIMSTHNSTALIYVFRAHMLAKDLLNPLAQRILTQCGYHSFTIDEVLTYLASRLVNYQEFPHEIGLFLGYPPEDVDGFILHKGKNFRCYKHWKVYNNEEQALITFAKFDKCKEVYTRLWQEGRDILQLTVRKQVVA